MLIGGSITSTKNTTNDYVNSLADFLLGDIKTSSYSLRQPLIGQRNYSIGRQVLPSPQPVRSTTRFLAAGSSLTIINL